MKPEPRPNPLDSSGPAPLDGVRVLDLTRLLPGPFATKLLVDMGAQVDKVEDPHAGDYLRSMPPLGKDGQNLAYAMLNRGKRSIVLDLKGEGRETLLSLLPRYDVLIESFRPGVLARLGLGVDVLHAHHPSLIVCSISAYGATGPLAERAGHDLNCVARSGVLGLSGPEGAAPQTPPMQLADMGGGLFAALRICGALRARAVGSAEKVHLDISMAESAASFGLFGFAAHAAGAGGVRGDEVLTGGLSVYRTYETADGKAVALASLEPKFWYAFCDAVGLERRDEALVPGPHQKALQRELEALFRSRTRDEWSALDVDCCLEPVLEPMEVQADAHWQARGLFDGAVLTTPAGSAHRGPAPGQGAHSEEILAELRDG